MARFADNFNRAPINKRQAKGSDNPKDYLRDFDKWNPSADFEEHPSKLDTSHAEMEWHNWLEEARKDGYRTTADSMEEQKRGDFDVGYLPFLDAPIHASPFIKGWVTLFAGSPYSGKTEVMVRLAHQWATGTHPLQVIYFHEELTQIFLNRITQLGYQSDHFVHIDCMDWGAEMFLDRFKHVMGDVVILDSTKSMKLELTDDKGVANFMQEFGSMARSKGMSSILDHHLNKSGAIGGGSVYGAHAWRAMSNTVIEMGKSRNDNQRKITAERRLVPFEPLITELVGSHLSVLGSPNDLTPDGIKQRTLNVLDESLTTKEILEAIGKPTVTDKTLTKYLEELAKAGRIRREPDIKEGSVRGATYRWMATPSMNSLVEVNYVAR